MEITEITLSHSNSDEDWRMERLEFFLLIITEKMKYALNLNTFWLKSINDHKGNLTFEWYNCPPIEFYDMIGEVWEYKFLENKSGIIHNQA